MGGALQGSPNECRTLREADLAPRCVPGSNVANALHGSPVTLASIPLSEAPVQEPPVYAVAVADMADRIAKLDPIWHGALLELIKNAESAPPPMSAPKQRMTEGAKCTGRGPCGRCSSETSAMHVGGTKRTSLAPGRFRVPSCGAL